MSSFEVLGSLAALFVAMEAASALMSARWANRLIGRLVLALCEAFDP